MSYCTQDDLLKLIPEKDAITLAADTGDEIDAAVVAECIAQADAEIDSYLAVRYQVPLSPVPDRVRALSVAMAIYYLFSRRSLNDEIRRQNYEDAVAFLKSVGAGKAEIVGAAGVEVPSASQDITEVTSATRIFSRETMGDW